MKLGRGIQNQNMDKDLVSEQKKKLLLDLKKKSKNGRVFLHLHRNIVITFVEAIEKAHHFFHFKDYLNKCDILKHDTSPGDVYDILVNMPELEVIIEKVDKEDLLEAINGHIMKVKNKRLANMRHAYAHYLPQCEFITSESNYFEDMEQIDRQGKFAELSSREREGALTFYKRHLFFKSSENLDTEFYYPTFDIGDQQEMEQAPLDPVNNLVFQTRKGNYCMDLNPEVELRRIEKSYPNEYYNLFVDRKPRLEFPYVESKMVKIMNVPCGAFVRDIKKFFSGCGKITYVKITSGDEGEFDTACVSFKETEGANRAAQLTGKEMITEGVKQNVKVVRFPGWSLPTYSKKKSKDEISVRKIVSALEKAEDVSNLLTGVLEKYWYYSQQAVEVSTWNLLAVDVKGAIDEA